MRRWRRPIRRWKLSADSAANWRLEFETVSQRVSGLTEELRQTRQRLMPSATKNPKPRTTSTACAPSTPPRIGKKGSLEAVIAEHGYSTESVRRLFQSGVMQGGMAPAGVLADFLEVETRYEGVVEDFLRDELNYIVVKSWDAADEGLRLLRTDVDGRATFLVHPEDSQAKFSFAVDENAHQVPPERPIVPLKNAIRVLNGFGRSLEVILPKLRDGYIVPDPDFRPRTGAGKSRRIFPFAVRRMLPQRDRDRRQAAREGPLSMKRELRDVLRQLGRTGTGAAPRRNARAHSGPRN